jgi:hypothetical protein
MNSNMRDESRNQRREEALARRLGEALDRVAPGGTDPSPDPCPDAELIAAYHEQALGPEEATGCEAHFAACSRCRKILAVLAASHDTPLAEKEVARLGELVAQAPSHASAQTVKAVRPIRLDWHTRWLAPALGVAAVLVVWFAMRPPWRGADQRSSGTLIAQAPKNETLPSAEAPPADQFSKVAPTKGPEADSATPSHTPKEQSANKTESAKPSADALSKKNLDEGRATDRLAPKSKVAESIPADEKKEQAEVNSSMAAAPPPEPPPSADSLRRPLTQAQSQIAGQASPNAPVMPGAATQSVTADEAAMADAKDGAAGNAPAQDKQALAGPRAISRPPLNGRNVESLSKADLVRVSPAQINSPSGKVFWRAGKSGRIERSHETGGAWILQASPSQEDWLAGSAVSDTICWIVGRNGAIARTTDAEHWGKIASPPMSAETPGKFSDLIEVTASSAETATVTTSGQRRYSTQDAGKTWQSR